jgi:hypothetical protein
MFAQPILASLCRHRLRKKRIPDFGGFALSIAQGFKNV